MTFYVHFTDDREIVALDGQPTSDHMSAEVTDEFALNLINCKTRMSDFIMGYSPRLKAYVPIDKALAEQVGAPARSFKIDRVDEHDLSTEVCITVKQKSIVLDLTGLEETDETRAYLATKDFKLVFHLVARDDTRRILTSIGADFNTAFSDKITEFKYEMSRDISIVTRKFFKSYSLVIDDGNIL